MFSQELALRGKLGIPKDAQKVIIFAQSSHIDPDWLLTAEQYQKFFTDRTFDQALKELERDKKYIYSVECIFFFKRYWEKHPEKQNLLRHYAHQGRIKFTGTGLTTPDTLLPEPENLFRDYLMGYYWLKKNGIEIASRVAYLPDDFGHSPSLPAILRELGYRYVAFSRIDGAYFLGTDYRPAREYPLPGSSAELLLKKLKTVDFIWQGQDGSEVLAHFNPFTYFQGDAIDKLGLGALYGIPLGLPVRCIKHTNAKIDFFINQLKPYSKTGYLFCPIGGDFNPPISHLGKILEQYNQTRYPKTGVYAVLAGLEDYMQLVEYHQDQLPVLQFDPNPTFMGFYSTRPGLKQKCRLLSQGLLFAEVLGVYALLNDKPELYPELSHLWEISIFSNHHDFITGTSRKRVYRKEQIPLLEHAQSQVKQIVKHLKEKLVLIKPPKATDSGKISWEKIGSRLKIENKFFQIELDEEQGGAIINWYDKCLQRGIISRPSNDIVLYYETGGLWRMGQELKDGKFEEITRASNLPAKLIIKTENNQIYLRILSQLEGKNFERILIFEPEQVMVFMSIKGAVNKRRIATVCFQTEIKSGKFIQEVPYGVIKRPFNKIYQPTFWAVKNWADLIDDSQKFAVHLALTAPAAVHAEPDGMLEFVALRNAVQEKIRGIPLPAFPVRASDSEEHSIEYGFAVHSQEDYQNCPLKLLSPDREQEFNRNNFYALVQECFKLDREDVVITSLKKTEDNSGIIVRLFRYNSQLVTVSLILKNKEPKQAFLTDGLERKISPLPIQGNSIKLEMPFSIATILLIFE